MLQRLIDRVHREDRNDAGFTLIELLVVITILGILAAIVVFSVSGVGDRGQKAACQTDTVTIRTAEEAYYAENSTYGTMTQLVGTAGTSFLSSASTYHTVAVSGSGTTATYAISTAPSSLATNPCGGAAGGALVDGVTVF